jgi:hypothetical protein
LLGGRRDVTDTAADPGRETDPPVPKRRRPEFAAVPEADDVPLESFEQNAAVGSEDARILDERPSAATQNESIEGSPSRK